MNLISDFNIDKIGSKSETYPLNVKSYKLKALEYINECITYLNDLKSQELENEEKVNLTKSVKSFDEFNDRNQGAIEFTAIPHEAKIDKRPFGLSIGVFWTISTTILGVFFLLEVRPKDYLVTLKKIDWKMKIRF